MNALLRTAAVVAALASTAASANIVYTVNHAIGAGSIMGSIETDGTQGTISSANFVDWTFTETSAALTNGSPATFGSALGGSINDGTSGSLSATPTDLIFDFGSGISSYLLFWASDFRHYYCLQSNGCYDFSGGGEAIGYGSNGPFSDYAEVLHHGSAQAFTDHSVPEPSALALAALGLFGVGFLRRKQA